MVKMEEQKKEIERLIGLGKEMVNSLLKVDFKAETITEENKKCFNFFIGNYEQWYSKAYAIIKVVLPDRLSDFTKWYRDDKRKSISRENYCVSDALRGVSGQGYEPYIASWLMRQQIGILKSCIDRFDSKLYDIQTTLQADMFDSEIESAKHLQKRGFLRASGAVCGVVIEKHLSQVCENRKIVLRKTNPSISDYNDALKDNVYDTINWRKIQHLGDLRNLCDHKKDREPTKEEVTELISGTDWLIKNVF